MLLKKDLFYIFSDLKKKKKNKKKKRGKKKKFRKKQVSLHRLIPGPLTLGDTLRMNSKCISGNFQPGSSETQKGGFERTSSNPTGSATGIHLFYGCFGV